MPVNIHLICTSSRFLGIQGASIIKEKRLLERRKTTVEKLYVGFGPEGQQKPTLGNAKTTDEKQYAATYEKL